MSPYRLNNYVCETNTDILQHFDVFNGMICIITCCLWCYFSYRERPLSQVINTPNSCTFHLPHYRFIYSCSIGNFFFAGARIFFQSLDAAIFLFSRVSQIPAESLVLPVISTNDRLTLGCELWVTSLAEVLLMLYICTSCCNIFLHCSLLLSVWIKLYSFIYFVSFFSFHAGTYLLHLLQLGK